MKAAIVYKRMADFDYYVRTEGLITGRSEKSVIGKYKKFLKGEGVYIDEEDEMWEYPDDFCWEDEFYAGDNIYTAIFFEEIEGTGNVFLIVNDRTGMYYPRLFRSTTLNGAIIKYKRMLRSYGATAKQIADVNECFTGTVKIDEENIYQAEAVELI